MNIVRSNYLIYLKRIQAADQAAYMIFVIVGRNQIIDFCNLLVLQIGYQKA